MEWRVQAVRAHREHGALAVQPEQHRLLELRKRAQRHERGPRAGVHVNAILRDEQGAGRVIREALSNPVLVGAAHARTVEPHSRERVRSGRHATYGTQRSGPGTHASRVSFGLTRQSTGGGWRGGPLPYSSTQTKTSSATSPRRTVSRGPRRPTVR